MKSVGLAANAMVVEIKRQFDANPNLLIPNHPDRPGYDAYANLPTDPPPCSFAADALLLTDQPSTSLR